MEWLSTVLGLQGGAEGPPPQVFHMGPNTLRISRKALHGKIRTKVVRSLKEKLPKDKWGVILLEGGKPFHVYSTDGEAVFRQESYFHYLFGVQEDSYYGALDVRSGKAYLFMPRLPDSFAVWFGSIPGPQDVKETYAVDYVHYTDELPAVLGGLDPQALHLLQGVNTDSGRATQEASFEGIEEFTLETDALFDVLNECRSHKSPEELDIIRYCNEIGSAAHVELMRKARPGMMEYQLESLFLHHCYFHGGCRNAPYTPIAASGSNSAILHYGSADAPNDGEIQEGELLLLDMGCEYYRYGSDITVTFPANGKFSALQKDIYEIVLATHSKIKAAIKPGVFWPDLHRQADRSNLAGLKELGLVQGDIDAMMDIYLGALFMPHGLGHLLGIDTHDVGGYGKGLPDRVMKPGLEYLRCGRQLEESMVITVEPGIYFNALLLNPAFKDSKYKKFLNKSRIEQYMSMGGVRLEDDVVVSPDGGVSLTNVPRTVAEIEAVMAGASWPIGK